MRQPVDDVDMVSTDNQLGVKVLIQAYELGGDVKNAYSILFKATGESHARVATLVYESVGREKAKEVLLAVARSFGVDPQE